MSPIDHLTQLLSHTDIINTPISLHGFLCCSLSQPVLSTSAQPKDSPYEPLKKLSKRISTKEMTALKAFAQPIQQQLDSDDLKLVLPEELNHCTTMQQGMQSLDEWIDGFNFAYAHFQQVKQWQTHADIREWLRDLTNVQRCCQQSLQQLDNLDDPLTEKNALDLMELTEFIRAGVYLCKTIWQQQQKLN